MDWSAEVNAIDTPVETALKDALGKCKSWDHVLILYSTKIDEHRELVGRVADEGQMPYTALWLVENHRMRILHEERDHPDIFVDED